MKQKYFMLVFLMIGLVFLSGCAETNQEVDEEYIDETNGNEENDYETDESIDESTPDQGDMIDVPQEDIDMIVEETINQALVDDSDDVEIGEMI
ncbi:MAG: hypothetical protein PWQ28_448 [Candidatus Woesearchaeota archaeon]|nr:hypothetical protein [Candidatus Woesearchaeota archaeon]MDK2907769.1 hypothetical protein [Candidatus Woesearchaeota archaeon]